ncbi:hypothetical protein F0L68_41140 [Solihabitans fulvus]|uniref:Uncharacterized protein n=1 Tax=Solihabitans fulvus TaxID=1892852 RepID=A0A5B2W1Q7_9PSEU|nr:hypothetical protein [Solihabitans fulvus]KAA2245893.1 hypothetical protein F0L68_41140 [Solihabitans fulvus]
MPLPTQLPLDREWPPQADIWCRHEFVDGGGLCAAQALPGSTRCSEHQDDGQPDVDLVEPHGAGQDGR